MSQHALPLDEPVLVESMVHELRGMIGRCRSRWQLLIVLEAAGLLVAAPLAYLWLILLADNVLHLPVWGRLLANVMFITVVATLAHRLVRRWRRASFTEDQVALAMERRTAGNVANQLINSIQLARDARLSQAPMSRTVVYENYRFLRQIRLRQSVESWPAFVCLAAAVLLIGGGAAYWAQWPDRFTNAAGRIFLPFANIEPIYDTILRVSPGDIDAAVGDSVAITIRIEGLIPRTLRILTETEGEQASVKIAVQPQARELTYTFESIQRTLKYAVRGGDYTSSYFTIRVPTAWQLDRVTAVHHYPAYTRLPSREIVSAAGDLEALIGTKSDLTFEVSRPVDEAVMLIVPKKPAESNGDHAKIKRVALRRVSPTRFTGHIEFNDVVGYRLELGREDGARVKSGVYALRITADQPPQLQLNGIVHQTEVMIDAVLPLAIAARDDYGLAEVGLFYRSIKRGSARPQNGVEGEWKKIRGWSVADQAVEFTGETSFAMGMLDVIEGEAIELALRARDTDPLKQGLWTTGAQYEVIATSVGAALQLMYEQILRSEGELRDLIEGHRDQADHAEKWIGKLRRTSGLRWDEKKNLDALSAAMGKQASREAQLRKAAFLTARQMVKQAGSLRVSVDMLADSEMKRAIQIVEVIVKQDSPQRMRAKLSDAKMTHERITRSLGDILDKYIEFRGQWELSHMIPFTKMLLDRQQRMADASSKYGSMSTGEIGPVQQRAAGRRQSKLLELAGLAHAAFDGMAVQHEKLVGPVLAKAFDHASRSLAAPDLTDPMRAASGHLAAGRWMPAESSQRAAAAELVSIYGELRKAQTMAAQQALDALAELAKSDLEAQKALQELKKGHGRSSLELDPNTLVLAELIQMRKLANKLKGKKKPKLGGKPYGVLYTDDMIDMLGYRGPRKHQRPESLKLAKTPSGEMYAPNSSDLPANRVRTMIQEQFTDVVGELLDEADAMLDDYHTWNLSAGWSMDESGEISKTGGDINSTSAAAATGNMKPPTNNVGGASRIGRQGARAHGIAVGDELINRRGRDEVQQGQFEVPDQAGLMKEILSEDPQKGSSVGIGGKRIKSNQSSFNVKDVGGWRNDIVDRMGAPQRRNLIVERKGAPLDPRVAARMYSMRNRHEQIIQRIKAIRKQLDNLYLPTDHLDSIMQQMAANLDRMGDSPDPEIFRKQIEQLDKLKSTVIVFGRPESQYGQGLQREQVIKGRILDEPAWPALPGYRQAVQSYYKKLSGLE